MKTYAVHYHACPQHIPQAVSGASGKTYGHAVWIGKVQAHVAKIDGKLWESGAGQDIMHNTRRRAKITVFCDVSVDPESPAAVAANKIDLLEVEVEKLKVESERRRGERKQFHQWLNEKGVPATEGTGLPMCIFRRMAVAFGVAPHLLYTDPSKGTAINFVTIPADQPDPVVEKLAESIYNEMRTNDPEGKSHPWQPGGNSLKQDEARREALRRLSEVKLTVRMQPMQGPKPPEAATAAPDEPNPDTDQQKRIGSNSYRVLREIAKTLIAEGKAKLDLAKLNSHDRIVLALDAVPDILQYLPAPEPAEETKQEAQETAREAGSHETAPESAEAAQAAASAQGQPQEATV